MNRRTFLQILGLAPVLPIAAKLPALKVAPAVATGGLTAAKLAELGEMLNSKDAPMTAYEVAQRNTEGWNKLNEWRLPPGYVSQYNANWNQILQERLKS